MAIEFRYGRIVWRVDTPDEAIALRQKLEAQDEAAIQHGEEPWEIEGDTERVWTPDTAMELLQTLGPQQHLFLQVMYEDRLITSDDAIKRLSLDSELAFAGVLSGLSKQLKKMDIKPWQLYTTQAQWLGKEKKRSFGLLNAFRWAAHELRWPANWNRYK